MAAYDLHVEEHEEGPLARPYRRAVARAEALLAETGAALERLLRENPVSRLVCFSGLIGRSPALCEAARRAGIDVLTVEGWTWRPGHMICNLNAPALEYDLDSWMDALGPWGAAQEHETRPAHALPGGCWPADQPAPGALHSVQRSSSAAPLPPAVAGLPGAPRAAFPAGH